MLVPGALGETMEPFPVSSTADTSGPPTQASPHFAQIDLGYGKTLYFQRWSEAGLNLYASQYFPSGWLPCTKFQDHNEMVACFEGNAAILLASDEAKQYDSNFSTLYVLGAIVYPEGNLRPPIVARWDTARQEYVDVGYTDRVGQSRFCRKCLVTSEIVSDIRPYVALNLSPYPRDELQLNAAIEDVAARRKAAEKQRFIRKLLLYGGLALGMILWILFLIFIARALSALRHMRRLNAVQRELDVATSREQRLAKLQREADERVREAMRFREVVEKEKEEFLREVKFDG